jgi:hypothetical protein
MSGEGPMAPGGGNREGYGAMAGRPGPVETYYDGLESPAEIAKSMAQAMAEHAAWKAAQQAKEHARLRLDLAARFMAAFLANNGNDMVDSPDAYRQYDNFCLARADSLLARWKETTPTNEPVEPYPPIGFPHQMETIETTQPSDSEGGEA